MSFDTSAVTSPPTSAESKRTLVAGINQYMKEKPSHINTSGSVEEIT